MILVVTGPSAAGKTTWCERHFAANVIAEYEPSGEEPDDSDPRRAAEFWCEVNCRRWQEAARVEQSTGLAVCDDDPMKLHYSWSLARIGRMTRRSWEHEVRANRAAVAAGALGLADMVLVSLPSDEELRRRRDADPTRRRRHFEVHRRLAGPLREWYQAVERVEPGRVRWDLPTDGALGELPKPRKNRCDVTQYDAIIEALPVRL